MKICMGCMNQIDDNAMTCPHCGFNESTYQQESYYLTPGTIVGGKYIVGRVMKYGGHTVSYIGMDAEVNRKVIVKEYLPSDFSTRSEGETEITIYSGDAQEQFENGLTNFLNEANVIQSLGSPDGIAKVYDCLAENDTGYVISEYVDGKSLNDILSTGKKYSVTDAKKIIEKLLRGLSKVHEQNIVHCDISPETIMISDSGDVKLVDFGATRYVTTSNSKSLAIILKQGYAAEEQYRSSGRRGSWTDVYAVAAVMYRMITGVTPQESVERALVDELKTPSKLGVSIAENVENALMNALNVYKNERTPDAKTFIQELNSPTVKRIKTQKKSNDTGKFPVWAKVLVASLFCIAVVAGVIFAVRGRSTDDPDAGAIAWKDFSGDTIEDAKNYFDEKHHTVTIETETVYDADESKDGTIEECSVTIDDINRAKNADSQENADIKVDANNHVTATVVFKVYSSKEIRYGELSTLNAYSLAKKMGVATDADIFGKETEKDGAYFEFEEIKLKEGSPISNSDIKDDGNKDKVIAIADIDRIIYYAGDFFYWEKLPTFEGYNIKDTANSDLFNPNTYEKENENSLPKKTDKTKCLYEDESLCDNECFSIGYDEGYVFEQTIPAGEEFDVTANMDKLDENGKLLYIVGKSFLGQINTGISGADLQKEIEGYLGKTNVCEIDGDATQPVKKGSGNVALYLVDQNGNRTPINNDCARKSDNLVIVIHTEEKVVTTQQRTTSSPKTTEDEWR